MTESTNSPRFIFFGTPEFAAIILDELEQKGFIPTLVITAPDKPKGRKLVVTPSEVKVWAMARNIPVLTPTKLNDENFLAELEHAHCDLFIVAAYGKIIPRGVLGMPKHGVLNVHPSLLPKFRGASPIESFILSNEEETGVTIMLLDEEMDHGPIITQRQYKGQTFAKVRPLYKGSELTKDLAHFGGALLAEIIPEWVGGLKAVPQDHARATYTKKITKEDGLLELGANLARYSRTSSIGCNAKVWTDGVFEKTYDASTSSKPTEGTPSSAPSDEVLHRKIRAYDDWPGTYFFIERNGKNIRVRVTDATYTEGKLTITRVVPEGKKEMPYEDFLRGLH